MTERSVEEVLEAGCAILMADPDNHEEGCCARGVCCYKDGLHPRHHWPEMIAGLDEAEVTGGPFDMAKYRYDEPCTRGPGRAHGAHPRLPVLLRQAVLLLHVPEQPGLRVLGVLLPRAWDADVRVRGVWQQALPEGDRPQKFLHRVQ
jgi:hypothetical protein